ncbi:probable chloroplast sensor kinase, chloroplastic at N-terminal half [Coccomyxa sp. Obi]|nr:probable chloroplast sensor kinase, chloroplastic at N-terminal half [Coccomyxa sp. Obi]
MFQISRTKTIAPSPKSVVLIGLQHLKGGLHVQVKSPLSRRGPRLSSVAYGRESHNEEALGTWTACHSSDFRELCYYETELLLEIVGQPFWNAAVFARVPDSFNSGLLEFQRVASVGTKVHEKRENTLTLGNSNAAEESLIKAELVELPDGGLVLPLAHHQFLVGLLFLEEASAPSPSALSDLTKQTLQDTASLVRSGRHGASQVLGLEGLERLKKVAQVLSLACSLEQRAALERARDDARSRHIGGLVEQVRGPLSALRTLGAMLVPRTQDVTRDVADGIVVQGNRLQDLVLELQQVLRPPNTPASTAQLPQPVPPITSVKQPAQCFVPAVLQTVMEATSRACENVGVRIRMDPMVAALAHEDSQAQASSSSLDSSAIKYNSNVRTPVAAGTSTSASRSDASPGPLRQAVSSNNRPSAPTSPTVQRPAARSQQQLVLLPPPSRALVLKEPVVPDKRQFFAQVSPEVTCEIVSCLIDAALQRTPRGGHVDISLRVSEGGILVDVLDSGTEMAERLQGLLRRNASQGQVSGGDEDLSAEAAMQRIWSGEASGSGIVALALAQNKARAVGARVDIDPQQQPSVHGTRTTLWLPATS